MFLQLLESPSKSGRSNTIIQHSGVGGWSIGELIVVWDGEQIVEPEWRLVEVPDELPGSVAVEEIRPAYRSQPQ